MNKVLLSKLNPKFANERQCKNAHCGGYFLSKTDEEYCPMCKEKGTDKVDIERKQEDVLYTEVNVVELSKRVAEIDDRLTKLEESYQKIAKSKQFKPKKCSNCGKKFTPGSGNQQICNPCRDILKGEELITQLS